MNTRVLRILEFDRIKQQIAPFVHTEMGRQLLTRLAPSADRKEVQRWLDETKDGSDLLRLKGGLPLAELVGLQLPLRRLEIGASLNGKELAAISRSLQTVAQLRQFFRDLDPKWEFRVILELSKHLISLPEQSQRLRRSIESDGSVLDTASPILQHLRQQIQQQESQIRSRMDGYTHGNQAKYLSEAIVTIRDDRYVIPVRSEYRHQFGGIIHDQSASGQTVYVEPQSVLEMNNKRRQIQLAVKQEISRIFAELSAALAPYTQELRQNQNLIGHFDLIDAKAHYAAANKATEPIIDPDNAVQLRQAKHPLLNRQHVVANDIAIGKDYQTMVVTGPNTGGKTITMKTLGLLQLMAQAGLFIPAREESRVGVFHEVFADIGDEQSIEQNLSTFSGHMDNIIKIMQQVGDQDLVLLDELCAGTDPQEGASLAIAILDYFGATGADVMASTHYPELKLYGYERPQTINASMEFNADTLQPTYRLLIGVPGRSNAFDISQRLGLPKTIVAAAKALMNGESQDLNKMISSLEKQRLRTEKTEKQLHEQLDAATTLHHDLATAYTQFKTQKDNQLVQAKQKANDIVERSQQEADQVISQLRKMKLNSGGSQIKEDQLIAAKGKLNALHQDTPLRHNRVLKKARQQKEIHVGDDVSVPMYDQQGVVMQQLGKNSFEVQLGKIKMKLDGRDLEKIKAPQAPQKEIVTVRHQQSSVRPQLDLRGQRYEEAVTNLERYLDSALLANYESVTIIHGKGTGALRQGVQSVLKQNPRVKKFNDAPPSAGGSGATIVYFK